MLRSFFLPHVYSAKILTALTPTVMSEIKISFSPHSSGRNHQAEIDFNARVRDAFLDAPAVKRARCYKNEIHLEVAAKLERMTRKVKVEDIATLVKSKGSYEQTLKSCIELQYRQLKEGPSTLTLSKRSDHDVSRFSCLAGSSIFEYVLVAPLNLNDAPLSSKVSSIGKHKLDEAFFTSHRETKKAKFEKGTTWQENNSDKDASTQGYVTSSSENEIYSDDDDEASDQEDTEGGHDFERNSDKTLGKWELSTSQGRNLQEQDKARIPEGSSFKTTASSWMDLAAAVVVAFPFMDRSRVDSAVALTRQLVDNRSTRAQARMTWQPEQFIIRSLANLKCIYGSGPHCQKSHEFQHTKSDLVFLQKLIADTRRIADWKSFRSASLPEIVLCLALADEQQLAMTAARFINPQSLAVLKAAYETGALSKEQWDSLETITENTQSPVVYVHKGLPCSIDGPTEADPSRLFVYVGSALSAKPYNNYKGAAKRVFSSSAGHLNQSFRTKTKMGKQGWRLLGSSHHYRVLYGKPAVLSDGLVQPTVVMQPPLYGSSDEDSISILFKFPDGFYDCNGLALFLEAMCAIAFHCLDIPWYNKARSELSLPVIEPTWGKLNRELPTKDRKGFKDTGYRARASDLGNRSVNAIRQRAEASGSAPEWNFWGKASKEEIWLRNIQANEIGRQKLEEARIYSLLAAEREITFPLTSNNQAFFILDTIKGSGAESRINIDKNVWRERKLPNLLNWKPAMAAEGEVDPRPVGRAGYTLSDGGSFGFQVWCGEVSILTVKSGDVWEKGSILAKGGHAKLLLHGEKLKRIIEGIQGH